MKIVYLLPFLFLTACTEKPTPTNLRIVEVELVQVDYGFRSLAVIWIKDKVRGVTLDDTITFEKEVILSYCVYEEDKQVVKQEHTFILDNLEELDKFIKWYDMSNYVVSYQGELYYTLIIGGKDGTYIELEDGTLVKVEE